MFGANPQACEWFLLELAGFHSEERHPGTDGNWLKQVMLSCPHDASRVSFADLVLLCFRVLRDGHSSYSEQAC